MKNLIFMFWIMMFSLRAAAAAPMCIDLFSEAQYQRIFSPSGLKSFVSPSLKKNMVYDFKEGSQKSVWLLIHGLGDDMGQIERLASLAEKDGYGILRVDLLGHGETLKRYLLQHKGELPESLNYGDNVVLLKELITSLNIKDLTIVGHSYGGGIAFGVAAELAKQKGKKRVPVRSVHMLAPYVQRIDKFLRNYFQSPSFLVDQTSKAIDTTGWSGRSIMDPMYRFVWSMTSQLKSTMDYFSRMLVIDKYQDLAMDPWLEGYMRRAYKQYFVQMAGKPEYKMSEAEREEVSVKVEAALKVTKGIRDFDLLDASLPLPELKAPLQILGGDRDTLVIPAQLQEFDLRLANSKIAHVLKFIEGPQANHLFPRLMAEDTYKEIREFQKGQPGN